MLNTAIYESGVQLKWHFTDLNSALETVTRAIAENAMSRIHLDK